MIELLDAVSDCVYICSKPAKDSQPEGLYANLKMDQFFGRSVLTRKQRLSGPNRSKLHHKNPLTKRIFASAQLALDDERDPQNRQEDFAASFDC